MNFGHLKLRKISSGIRGRTYSILQRSIPPMKHLSISLKVDSLPPDRFVRQTEAFKLVDTTWWPILSALETLSPQWLRLKLLLQYKFRVSYSPVHHPMSRITYHFHHFLLEIALRFTFHRCIHCSSHLLLHVFVSMPFVEN